MSGGSAETLLQVGQAQVLNVYGSTPLPPAAGRPCAVPPSTDAFTDRLPHLASFGAMISARLDESGSAGAPLLVLCQGRRGVGKTELSFELVKRYQDRFTGGHLFVELGLEQYRGGVAMGEVAKRLLRQLGVDDAAIPATTPERADQLRMLLARREGAVVVVLDDVRQAQPVRWLLPNRRDCVVLVTTDETLGELIVHGAEILRVEPLDAGSGLELVRKITRDDPRCEDGEAVAELVALCEGLPVVLGAAALQLALRPELTVAALVVELVDEKTRFARLTADVPAVGAVFSLVYEALSPSEQAVYRALGLPPEGGGSGLTVEPGVVAAAAGQSLAVTRDALSVLRARGLVEILDGTTALRGRAPVPEAAPRTGYRVHGLVRAYARHLITPDDEAHGLETIARYRLFATAHADRLITGSRLRFTPEPTGTFELAFEPSREDALDWLDQERAALVATVRVLAAQERADLDELIWPLAESLTALFLNRRHLESWRTTGVLGAEAAERVGRGDAAARLWSLTSRAMSDLGLDDEAERATRRAVELAGEQGNTMLLASAWEFRGRVLERTDAAAATEAYERALELNREIGERRGEALLLFFLGRHVDDVERARRLLTDSIELLSAVFDGRPDRRMRARARAALGAVLLRQGDRDGAAALMVEAVTEFDALGVWGYQAETLNSLAELEDSRGHGERADSYRERARQIREYLNGES